jgi:hypothetical protein
MIIFIARIRKSSLPISSTRFNKSVIGVLVGIIAIILGILTITFMGGIGVFDYLPPAGFGAITIGEGIISTAMLH